MPNHVANVIKMEGIAKLPLFSMEKGERFFDFNKLIPMPESLNLESGSSTDENVIYYLTEKCTIPFGCLEEEKKTLAREMVHNLFSGEKWAEEVFRRVNEKAYRESEGQKNKRYENGKTYVSNYQQYGCTTWYDWCYKYWGTKWNAYSFEFLDDNTIKFETAWSCPEPVIKKLAETYPDSHIEHWWADEDMGNNTGHAWYEDGEWFGGYDDSCSSDAYEHYNFCWGDSDCIYQDEKGNYCKHECEVCRKCY